ncbi:MAG: tRNA (guanosine(37)-N1)-methyltransferase TrmD, partial [Lachnospiraceae bacterium]|nr:tRNA (guanosine(37)-N1)-methyltransferase TrmD [Lachnospiraceae bacterium]
MNFHVLTLFPEMILSAMNNSIIKRAVDNGLVSINAVNIREYTNDKHLKVDDYPYGGGAGMLMQAQPVYDAYLALKDQIGGKSARVVFMTPQGKTFNQEMAKDFAKEDNLIFLCGHYEGIDERVLEEIVTDEVSIGDFVLTGGELPAMAIIDTVSRLVPGVLNNEESAVDESFSGYLL